MHSNRGVDLWTSFQVGFAFISLSMGSVSSGFTVKKYKETHVEGEFLCILFMVWYRLSNELWTCLNRNKNSNISPLIYGTLTVMSRLFSALFSVDSIGKLRLVSIIAGVYHRYILMPNKYHIGISQQGTMAFNFVTDFSHWLARGNFGEIRSNGYRRYIRMYSAYVSTICGVNN